jgi:NitT/TauT family transport system permease protein
MTDTLPQPPAVAAADPVGGEVAVAPAATRTGRSLRAKLGVVVPAVVALAVVVAIWQLVSTQLISHQRQFLLPTPAMVVSHGFLDGRTMHEIANSLWLTTKLSLFGLGVAIVLGIAVGMLMFRFRWAERASYPYLVALQAVPVLAIAPLMTVAFGYSFWAKSIIVVIIAFFPIPTTLLLGMKSVDSGLIDLFRLNGAGWSTRLRKLCLPNALPSLFAGLRISAGLSVIGAIVGELFFQQGNPGLGQRIYAYQTNMQYPQLYTAIIVSSLLGIAIFTLFGWIGQRAIRSWHESAVDNR